MLLILVAALHVIHSRLSDKRTPLGKWFLSANWKCPPFGESYIFCLLWPREGYFKVSEILKFKTKIGILNTCIRIIRHRSKGYKNLTKSLFWKHNSISLRLVRDISVHEDNVPSVKYIRNSHVCLFAFFCVITILSRFFLLPNKAFWSSLLIPLVCTIYPNLYINS